MAMKLSTKRISPLVKVSLKTPIPYWYLLIGPALLTTLGAVLNWLVMYANGGQMPVLAPNGCEDVLLQHYHVCATSQSHLMLLADIMRYGSLHVSIGDFCIDGGVNSFWPALTAWCALMIKDQSGRN